MLKCSAEPRPVAPSTPKEWASSTISHALIFLLQIDKPRKSAMSPSMEYRPSTTISARLCRWRCQPSSASSASRSLWRKAKAVARESLVPTSTLLCDKSS